jgi:uracil-DNA glycosylase
MTIKKKRKFLELPEGDWVTILEECIKKPELLDLESFLKAQYENCVTIYPPRNRVFAALEHTQFYDVRVVILGQDPYHGPHQANGLCFSVMPGVAVPPSLANIYRELRDDVGCLLPSHGCLHSWAKQGVLLINSVLTVEKSAPGSHRGKGWEVFTDAIITLLNDKHKDLVFFLWGSYARKKAVLIDRQRHMVLEAAHPSPLSAYRGFYGCKHFSRCNTYLKNIGKTPIDWQLPSLRSIE